MRVLDAKRAATCWNLAGGMDPGSKGNLTLAAAAQDAKPTPAPPEHFVMIDGAVTGKTFNELAPGASLTFACPAGNPGCVTPIGYQTCGGEVLGYLPGAQSSEFARTGAWPVYFAAVSIGGCTRRVSSVTA